MAILNVKSREFQRSPADWLHRARRGDTVVIVSPDSPTLTLQVGRPKRGVGLDWNSHFDWLKKQKALDGNPVHELRAAEDR